MKFVSSLSKFVLIFIATSAIADDYDYRMCDIFHDDAMKYEKLLTTNNGAPQSVVRDYENQLNARSENS
jgi:hypothetical protein